MGHQTHNNYTLSVQLERLYREDVRETVYGIDTQRGTHMSDLSYPHV